MNKPQPSRLDQYADVLAAHEAEGKTLAQMQQWLADEGCKIGLSQLSRFLSSQRDARMQDRLLAQITSGARQCQEIEKQFGQNPAPELETLIKLNRVIVLQLATRKDCDPESLKLADQLTRTAIEYTSGRTKFAQKERELKLATDKFQFNAAKACLAKLPELKAISNSKELTTVQKIDQIRLKLFGEVVD